MKNVPQRIFLQCDSNEASDDFNEHHQVTWCVDSIHNSDIPFVPEKLLKDNKVSFKQELYNNRKAIRELKKQVSELQSALATERHKLTAISKGFNPPIKKRNYEL